MLTHLIVQVQRGSRYSPYMKPMIIRRDDLSK